MLDTQRSFAVWYESKKTIEERIKLEVHINFWNYHSSDRKYCFLDFGFLVTSIKDIKSINLHMPFVNDAVQVSDLGAVIASTNETLVNAIFNEDYIVQNGTYPKTDTVSTRSNKEPNKDPRPDFYLYHLDPKTQLIKSESNKKSSLLRIDISGISDDHRDKPYYFRIRINVSEAELSIVKNTVGESSFFQEAFSNIEIIDFRLNDTRSCGEHLREEFEKGSKFIITKIHYLVMRHARDEIIYQGVLKSRLLEKELWLPYLSGTSNDDRHDQIRQIVFPTGDIVAYHIPTTIEEGKTKEIKSFTNLMRFRYKRVNPASILVSIAFIFALSVVASSTSSYISRNIVYSNIPLIDFIYINRIFILTVITLVSWGSIKQFIRKLFSSITAKLSKKG